MLQQNGIISRQQLLRATNNEKSVGTGAIITMSFIGSWNSWHSVLRRYSDKLTTLTYFVKHQTALSLGAHVPCLNGRQPQDVCLAWLAHKEELRVQVASSSIRTGKERHMKGHMSLRSTKVFVASTPSGVSTTSAFYHSSGVERKVLLDVNVMMSVVLEGSSETDVADAASALRRGEVVAFPTETVYGLGADATNSDAVRGVFEAKGRPSDNPLIVHLASIEALDEAGFVEPMTAPVRMLAEQFWPGPLTLVMPLNTEPGNVRISPLVTAGLDTVAVRVPKHPVASALLAATGLPIAAPSANSSGKPSPTSASHVMKDLNGKIFAVLDGGAVNVGIESTVLDISSDVLTILRPGAVTQRQLEETTGQVVVHATSHEGQDAKSGPRAPGMKYRHYAPSSSVKILYGGVEEFVATVKLLHAERPESLIGVLSWEDTCTHFRNQNSQIKVVTFSAGERGQVALLAQRLFSALRWLDEEQHVDVILAQGVQETDGDGLGFAVMNRLTKAASAD